MKKISFLGFGCELCGKPARNIHHKDRNRSNNNLDNLMKLCVPCHKRIHGSYGETHPLHKLTEVQAKKIKFLREKGISVNYLAKEFQLSEGQISRICNNKEWSHLFPMSCIRKSKLTDKNVEQIKSLVKDGLSQRRVAKIFQVSYTNIQNICKGKIWTLMKN